MLELMDQETKDKIKELFGGITGPVRIIYFASEKNCHYCRDQRFLLEEVVRLSNKLQLVVYDFDKDRELAKRYRVDKVPATIIVGKREYGIRFFGYCASHEFTSLINALVLVGDCLEEALDPLCHHAGQLGLLGVPAFVFQEGHDPDAARGFREIARLMRGAYCAFDAGSARQLRELLSAVAVYAVGGRPALTEFGRRHGGLIQQLTQQL